MHIQQCSTVFVVILSWMSNLPDFAAAMSSTAPSWALVDLYVGGEFDICSFVRAQDALLRFRTQIFYDLRLRYVHRLG